MQSWVSAIPHRTIARAGFRCRNLSSCLSCASCASMLIIRFVAARAVEAVPYRFVALRVLLIVTYGAAFAPARLEPPSRRLQGGSDSSALNQASCPIPWQCKPCSRFFVWMMAPLGVAGVPPAQCRGTASPISATRSTRQRRRGSLSVWPLWFTPTGWLPAKSR